MTLIIYDPVHGEILLEECIYKIIDTLEFQRLRNLKQLGFSYIKFPAATHTRFEHCVGVCFLIQKFLKILETNSNIQISYFHKKCVMIAGLLHDIGHGPFSHMWERVMQSITNNKYEHEDISCSIAEILLKRDELKFIFEDQCEEAIKIIKGLIKGNRNVLNKDDQYLAEIVNNKYCELDLDKLDYIQRDAYYLKNAVILNTDICSWFYDAKVIKVDNETHIAYNEEHYESIANLFNNRSNLHIKCYQNELVLGAELTVCKIIQEAEENGFLLKNHKLSDIHNHLDKFHLLDDSILNIILLTENPNLLSVQEKIKNFYKREFCRNITSSKCSFSLGNPEEHKIKIPTGQVFMLDQCKKMKFYDSNNKIVSLSELMYHNDGFYVKYVNYR